MKKWTLGLALWGLALSANAGTLTFKNAVQKVPTAADTQRLEVLFPFENRSKDVVHITKYDAPCSCMTAEIQGGTRQQDATVKFAPGESGVVKGIFDLGNAKGELNKQIILWEAGDPDEAPSMVLEAQVSIPKLIEASPTSLSWELNGQRDPKVIRITVNDAQPIQILKHSSSNPQLEYQWKTLKDGFEYELVVTPKSTDKPIFAAIRMTTDSKNPRFKSLQTFMTVKPSKN